ncbi:MAG: glycosyltransferase family 4 protein [Kineosporiaceae bacterium]
MKPETLMGAVPLPGERRAVPRAEQLDADDFADAVDDGVQLPVPDHGDRPPRVVMFRPNTVEHDTRGKKIALSLARGGYDVISLNCVLPGADPDDHQLALGPVQIVTVALSNRHRATHNMRLATRRRRMLHVIDWTGRDEYVTRIAELRGRVNAERDRRLAEPKAVAPRAGHLTARLRLITRRGRWKSQAALDAAMRQAWRAWDRRRQATELLATDKGNLPELADYADTFGKTLDELEPDVLHAHHPTVLPIALRAARRIRARGGRCIVVYDARENYSGIPAEEQGHPRRHAVLLRQEERSIADVAAVFTVSDPIAEVLQQRYHLARRPTVLLNAPPYVPVAPGGEGPSLRTVLGMDPQTPLLVYSGGISRARGIEVLVEALAHLTGVHLALVTVPFPHPMMRELNARAARLGVADRVHAVAPVGQGELIGFLSSADVALHPLPGGSPNHDQALPNKLFEYLHAGLPLVVSDARLMADFVRAHGLGEVFRTDDALDLAAAVRRVLDAPRSPDSRAELASTYSWQSQEPLLLETYHRVAPLPPGAAPALSELPAEFPDLQLTPG